MTGMTGNSTCWWIEGTGPGPPEKWPKDLISPAQAKKIVYGASRTWRRRARHQRIIRAYKSKFFSCWLYSRADVLALIGVVE